MDIYSGLIRFIDELKNKQVLLIYLFRIYFIDMIMKTLYVLVFLQLAVMTLHAQHTVKRFCQLRVYNKVFSSRNKSIELDYGQLKNTSPFRDSLYVIKLLRVESFNTLVSALNYMSDLGWKYESSTANRDTELSDVVVLFSKEFEPKDLRE